MTGNAMAQRTRQFRNISSLTVSVRKKCRWHRAGLVKSWPQTCRKPMFRRVRRPSIVDQRRRSVLRTRRDAPACKEIDGCQWAPAGR